MRYFFYTHGTRISYALRLSSKMFRQSSVLGKAEEF